MNKKRSRHFVIVNNKRYDYYISSTEKKDVVHFLCEGANIEQIFHRKDLSELLILLEDYILDEIEYRKKQKDIIRFRVSAEEKEAIVKKAFKKGYSNVSSFLRDLAMKA